MQLQNVNVLKKRRKDSEIFDPQQGKVIFCWMVKDIQQANSISFDQMIKLRLKRFGKKREASFRLVACNSTSRRDGRPLQELGFYNPRTKETRLDTEALRLRLSQGAQPTDAVRSLLEKGGLIEKTNRPQALVRKDTAKTSSKVEATSIKKEKVSADADNESNEIPADKAETQGS